MGAGSPPLAPVDPLIGERLTAFVLRYQRGCLLLVAAFLVAFLSAFLVAALAFDVVEHWLFGVSFLRVKNKKAREPFQVSGLPGVSFESR